MKVENINKIIFDNLVSVSHTGDFIFSVDEDDDITEFTYKDNIVINVQYVKDITTWGEQIKYPKKIDLIHKYNPRTNKEDLKYYSALATIDSDNSDANKLVIILGDGRTEEYRHMADFYKFDIPSFVRDVIGNMIPIHIVYRNYENNEPYCAKSIYFLNKRVNVYGYRLGSVITDKTFKVYYNSGFIANMNRIDYNVKELKKTELGSTIFTVQYPIKMLDIANVNDSEAQENTYEFHHNATTGLYTCNEIYAKKKGYNVDRTYDIELDRDGMIHAIKFYKDGIYSDVQRVLAVRRDKNTISVKNIYNKDELADL